MTSLDATEFKRLLGQFPHVRAADYQSANHIRKVEHAQIHTHLQVERKPSLGADDVKGEANVAVADDDEQDGPDTITVHVKSLKGDSYDIKIGAGERVAVLKQRVARASAVPPDRQRLILKGKALPDDKTLADLTIGDATKIHLTIKNVTPVPEHPESPVPMNIDAPAPAPIAVTTTPHFWHALEVYLSRHVDARRASELVHEFAALYRDVWKDLDTAQLDALRHRRA